MITQNEISSLNLSPTKKDFVQIWNELIEVASKITERWDPTSTNESDPGIVLLKVLAGIADKLNYNIDKNILEAFMPTAAQMESMQKLCELVGYNIKYYQSAETTVRISYTGDTSEGSEERIDGFGLPIPKFTTITNADKDITYVTTNTIPVYITNSTPNVEVHCIEGQISQCESSNEHNLITLAQLDDNYRYYLPETQIAANGIFVYNATSSVLSDNSATLTEGTEWIQVDNLNVQAPGIRVFKFGYDSFEGRPYIAFPEDIGSLIEDGLFIYFVRTSGLSGNISARTLEVLEIPTGDAWKDFSAEQFEVVNANAATNGSNIESISTAYNNFKKTIGTFDTLVTCRDYMNKIYSLMDADNSPLVSNILVTDIRNDINNAITLCSFNEFGILYKELPLTIADGSNAIDHFDLVLYPFKTFTQVSSGATDLITPYNDSFTYTDQKDTEIKVALDDLKTCAHNFIAPDEGDLVAINNYLRLDALIATSSRVSEAEAKDILKNIKVALVNEFNLRKLDFGEEIPFDSILAVIESADARIKVVSLQEPALLTTYSVKTATEGSKEYGIASTVDIESDIQKGTYKKTIYGVTYEKDETDGIYCKTAKEIYNKLALRNILAGRVALFDYDETFISTNSEKPYTITKDITAALSDPAVLLEDPQFSSLTAEEIEDLTTRFTNIASRLTDAVRNKLNSGTVTSAGELILHDTEENLIKSGFYSNNSVLTLKVISLPTDPADVTTADYKLYETYEYNFLNKNQANPDPIPDPEPDNENPVVYGRTRTLGETPMAVSDESKPSKFNGTINNVAKIEALCEIESDTDVFNNITLGKNEVIKFRAPNLITTQTFPAYVYYNYTKNSTTTGQTNNAEDTEGRPAVVESLANFINSYSAASFFTGLWGEFSPDIFTAKLQKNTEPVVLSDNLSTIFNSAIMVGTDIDNNTNKTSRTVLFDKAAFENYLACFNKSDKYEIKAALVGYFHSYFKIVDLSDLTDPDDYSNLEASLVDYYEDYLAKYEAENPNSIEKPYSPQVYFETTTPGLIQLGECYRNDYFDVDEMAELTQITFKYYPLNVGTMDNWSKYVREKFREKYNENLPGTTTLWRLSNTYSHPIGRLVTEEGQRLYAQTGDHLAGQAVAQITYLCTDLGKDPKYYNIAENGDIQLEVGDKLYIHYTPSSTNEDGETTSAEPISVVYEGKADGEPIILRPRGFTLMPSENVHTSGTSWKKTDVAFGNEKVNLLALGANEQIEMRSISRVVLNKPARFYKNFDNADLENGKEVDYELKDGEYIFYTDVNTQEAAYYGSGSVITLKGGARIPKNSSTKEISEILQQGLHIVPWSGLEALNETKTITVTEYQYRTLVEGDTIKQLNLSNGASKIGAEWKPCFNALYRLSGVEEDEKLPVLELNPSISSGWEVCSILELATAPGLTQTLRANKIAVADTKAEVVENPDIVDENDKPVHTKRASVTTITNKLNIYQSTGVEISKDPIVLTPQLTENPASGYTGEYLKDNSSNVLVDASNTPITQTVYEPISIKLDTLVQSASGNFIPVADKSKPSAIATTVQMRVFKETVPEIAELSDINEVITPVSVKNSLPLDYSSEKEYSSENINSYWTKLDPSIALFKDGSNGSSKIHQALNLHFMVPTDLTSGSGSGSDSELDSDLFGIFSIYFDTAAPLKSGTKIPEENYRVFIDIPSELGSYDEVISIFNNRDIDGNDAWWQGGTGGEDYPNRLYLRAGLNCIKVLKSCNLLIKAETSVSGNILYDNLRLIKGRDTNGINLELIDFDATSITGDTSKSAIELANELLAGIAAIDTDHEFYYNVPIENSLAMEFGDSVKNSLSNPYTLYDINNTNNNFVISKLDVNYLDTGLRIAKSSRSSNY